jgi:hypothetical protein
MRACAIRSRPYGVEKSRSLGAWLDSNDPKVVVTDAVPSAAPAVQNRFCATGKDM